MIKENTTINCTGCSACYNICPNNAIKMVENNEGFKEPVIDEQKCTKCGLCEKHCPILKPQYDNTPKPECYVFMANDEIRINSASGGVFPVLAYHFIDNGGYVAGAVWTQDWQVQHIVSDKKEDIEKMRSSKYLQSNIGDCYKQIKVLLEQDKKVLFTGTPCQVAGLRSYLQKEYKNLYYVDIVCHGVASPKVFRKYLNEEYNVGEIAHIDFKNKTENGWGSNLSIKFNNGNKCIKKYIDDSYYALFNKIMINRKVCSDCNYAQVPRIGDMTIGDFWGIKKKYNDQLGTSVILINNLKGEELLSILRPSSKLLIKRSIKDAVIKNPNIIKASSLHKDRNKFFEQIDNITLKEAKERYIGDKADCMIINFWSAVNYGAILTCYGVQCLVEKLGKYPKVINYIGYPKSVECKDYKKSFSYLFSKQYLNLTNKINNYDDLFKLNKNCNTFITGSDQVWRNSCAKGVLNDELNWTIFFLDFVRSNKRKLSYSASLGTDELTGTSEDIEKINFYLSQFDDISVREDRGVEILQENFGIHSTQLIDGVFHIPFETLQNMTDDYPYYGEKYIGCFTLPYFKNQDWYKTIVENISQKLGLPIVEFDFSYDTPVEKWLSFIKNSEFMITDSYHGTLFSIIFNKQFIHIKNADKVQSRFDTIYRLFNINKTVSKFNAVINYDDLLRPVDWDFINNKIKEEKIKAENWMKKALEKDISKKQSCPNFIEKREVKKRESNYDNAFILLLLNRDKIYRDYLRCKILANFTFGKRREHYKKKKNELKVQVKQIRKFMRGVK